MYCNYLNQDCLTFLFPHQTPHTEYHICMLTYTRWQGDIKASVRLGERTSWTSWLPLSPSIVWPTTCQHRQQQAQLEPRSVLDPLPGGTATMCQPLLTAVCRGNVWPWAWKVLSAAFLTLGKTQLFWNGFSGLSFFFFHVNSRIWQNASLSLPNARWLVPVTPSHQKKSWCTVPHLHTHQHGAEPLPATHWAQPRSLQQLLTHFPAELWILLSEVSPEQTGTFTCCTCPWKFTGFRSEPSRSTKCPVVPPAHLLQKDVSLNWQASATFLWHLTGNIFLTWRVYIFAFHALKYTDL